MIANVEDVKKCFYVGGPIDPARHYYVHRERETIDIVNLIEFNYVLLHAHRQAGKSSMIKPIILALTEKSANFLNQICVIQIGSPNAVNVIVSVHSIKKIINLLVIIMVIKFTII